jgi:cysteinyl-tRNA synthetase
MRLYNTLGREIEEFKPQTGNEVKLYTCGPTVYDYSHIGNLRAYVFGDTLRRALQANGYAVKHVMNITDVGHLVSDDDEGEDKLEKGAGRENKSVQEVAEFYTEAFLADIKELNILEPNAYKGPSGAYARATDFIDEQTEIVKLLLDKGFAYQTRQAIYFDVSKLSDYGKLTGQRLADKEVAARSEVISDPEKKNPQDFALWFFTVGRFENHSLHWPSPWGEGFPGWHLECSAIIHATLGEPIDIHTGGVDHIGTHHTNEIAQTEAAFGLKLANYWMHNEHLLSDGRKMSKSLGNYHTLKDITDKGYEPLALRLLFLQSHYRSQANFTWESVDASASFLKKLQAWADLRFQRQADLSPAGLESIKSAINNDLNTPGALAILSGMAEEGAPDHSSLQELDKLLGLGLADRNDAPGHVKELIASREEARSKKEWTESDRLRSELIKEGFEINDSPDGPIWRRT